MRVHEPPDVALHVKVDVGVLVDLLRSLEEMPPVQTGPDLMIDPLRLFDIHRLADHVRWMVDRNLFHISLHPRLRLPVGQF